MARVKSHRWRIHPKSLDSVRATDQRAVIELLTANARQLTKRYLSPVFDGDSPVPRAEELASRANKVVHEDYWPWASTDQLFNCVFGASNTFFRNAQQLSRFSRKCKSTISGVGNFTSNMGKTDGRKKIPPPRL